MGVMVVKFAICCFSISISAASGLGQVSQNVPLPRYLMQFRCLEHVKSDCIIRFTHSFSIGRVERGATPRTPGRDSQNGKGTYPYETPPGFSMHLQSLGHLKSGCAVPFPHQFSIGWVKGKPHQWILAGAVGMGRGDSHMKLHHVSCPIFGA